jgi:hypothetical protein
LPMPAAAQTPKRGGTLTLPTWDPPHFDHLNAHAYKTHVVISFTHSRLLRHKAGASVRPGSFAIEGALAESWQQTSETTYLFKLKKGVRFHAKPPANGRELTADDVRYTFERTLAEKGSTNASMYRSIAKIDAQALRPEPRLRLRRAAARSLARPLGTRPPHSAVNRSLRTPHRPRPALLPPRRLRPASWSRPRDRYRPDPV